MTDQSNDNPTTVCYDGSCPICLVEIRTLKTALGPDQRFNFEDVSDDVRPLSCDVSRDRMMARFHVKIPSGEIVSGAQAFTEIWSKVRGLAWLRPLGRFPVSRAILNGLYFCFLLVRPILQDTVRSVTNAKQRLLK
ncbi:thiol-disulfide oxidoreductase DCC family protein [Parvularcula sp. IMCC14364]|uniref:thiol-disulfide oxidoreductase DCC family protein n=1 Tax=Parvularcula sp. IMCC14364 TaxID=3067902 RepID=UPI00355776C3